MRAGHTADHVGFTLFKGGEERLGVGQAMILLHHRSPEAIDQGVVVGDAPGLFGEDLLVAPVSDETEEREIYFPKGRWISLWNLNDEISGPVQRSVEVPIDKIPVYVREGSFLPLRLNESLKLGESMSESETEMILAVVPQNDSIVKETLYERSGAKTCCGMEKNGETIQLQISGRTAELYVMLAGIHWKNTEAIVNGRTLTKVTAREGLYFTEGYLELEEGILVKINPSAESVIKIQKK